MSLKNSYKEHRDWAKYANPDDVVFIDFDNWVSLFNPENNAWLIEKRTRYGGSLDYANPIEYYILSYTQKNRVTKRLCFKTYKDYKHFHKFVERYKKITIYNEQKENLDKFLNTAREEDKKFWSGKK